MNFRLIKKSLLSKDLIKNNTDLLIFITIFGIASTYLAAFFVSNTYLLFIYKNELDPSFYITMDYVGALFVSIGFLTTLLFIFSNKFNYSFVSLDSMLTLFSYSIVFITGGLYLITIEFLKINFLFFTIFLLLAVFTKINCNHYNKKLNHYSSNLEEIASGEEFDFIKK